MKLFLLLPFIMLFLVSESTRMGHFAAAKSVKQTLISPMLPSPALMWADRTNVFVQDTIWLRFRLPHPIFLGILNPEGRFFYIVFPTHEVTGQLTPLADSESFAGMTCLAISTSLKADPYQYGISENKPVFTHFGTYTFIMGDNLHTCSPSENHQVKIRYQQKARLKTPKIASY